MSLFFPADNTPFQSKHRPTTKMNRHPPVGADLSRPPPIYRPPNYLIQSKHHPTTRMNPYPLVGADLSRPPPMYRPPTTRAKRQSPVGADLSRPPPMYRPQLKPPTI